MVGTLFFSYFRIIASPLYTNTNTYLNFKVAFWVSEKAATFIKNNFFYKKYYNRKQTCIPPRSSNRISGAFGNIYATSSPQKCPEVVRFGRVFTCGYQISVISAGPEISRLHSAMNLIGYADSRLIDANLSRIKF